jgi:formate/nitrite transporter FocA (FNT family)
MYKHTKEYVSAVLAGVMIGIGGTVYLSVDNHVVGSLLFAVGLYTILVFKLNLFTGIIGYLPDNLNLLYIELLVNTWVCNFAGVLIYGLIMYNLRPDLVSKATTICVPKFSQSLNTTFFMSIFCGLLMYIAVDNFKTNESYFSKIVGIFICVSVFILCKFEHCIADMFYIGMCSQEPVTSIKSLRFLLVVTLGNMLGSFIIPYYKKIKSISEKE